MMQDFCGTPSYMGKRNKLFLKFVEMGNYSLMGSEADP